MRVLARFALKVLTGVSTVFIAACYGIRYAEGATRLGRVVDAQSGAAIQGIRVSCIDGGIVRTDDVTDDWGEFVLPLACSEYSAEDVDGAANGSYAPATVPAPAGGDRFTIALDPLPPG